MCKIEFLRTKALFGGLEDGQLKIISDLLKEECFTKNRTIIKEGSRGDKMYMLIKGDVEILKYNQGLKEIESIAKLSEGDSFGEMELIDIQARSATVKALNDVQTVSLSNADMLKLSNQDIKVFSIIVINIARIISRKLRKTDDRLASILHQ